MTEFDRECRAIIDPAIAQLEAKGVNFVLVLAIADPESSEGILARTRYSNLPLSNAPKAKEYLEAIAGEIQYRLDARAAKGTLSQYTNQG